MNASEQRTTPGTPKVSVLLQTYNHEPFIAQAIEGVLLQRVSFPMELIIADDASTDGTRATVQRYARSHPDRIRLVLPEANLGSSKMFLHALAEARGEYIAYLEGDDYWTSPHKLSRQVVALDNNPDWAGCFHPAALVYEATGHPHPSGHVIPEVVDQDALGLDELVGGICFVPGPSWMHRRTSLNQLPSLDGLVWSDWLIHITAAQRGALGFLDHVLAAYRVHAGGAFNGLDRSAQVEEDLTFYHRLVTELPSYKELIDRCIANRHCQLAVEKARLPYDAPLLVIDPGDDLPLYFNGRWVSRFPDLDGTDQGKASLVEFDLACEELGQLPPATPHARPRWDPLESGTARDLFLLLPRGARPWVDPRHDLVGRLEEGAGQVFDDDWCSIYRMRLDRSLPRPQALSVEPVGGALEVVSVGVAEPLPQGLQGWLDSPKHGELAAAHAIYVVGWVLSDQGPVDAVEFELNEELICRTPVGVPRPDLAEAFGNQPYAERAGFRTIVNVAGEAGTEVEVELFAAMRSGARLTLGKLCLHCKV
jgi:glycosyltransferase involved in cell wall biosynthesis